MKERRQLTIGIHLDKYNSLSEKKAALEEALGQKVDWGTYLLMLASQKTLNESVAALHDSEEDEVNPDDFVEMTPWVTKEEVEEIVRSAVDTIVKELRRRVHETEGLSEESDNKP